MFAYYSVYGYNGYGVMGSYDAYLNNARIYLKESNCKRFHSFDEAANHAIAEFLERNKLNKNRIKVVEPSDMRLNSLVFRKYIMDKPNDDVIRASSQDPPKLIFPIKRYGIVQ